MRYLPILIALLLTPSPLAAQTHTAPRDTIAITKPTLLAFFLVNPAAIDSEPAGDLATIADDFAYYLGTITPLLDSLGVAVRQTGDTIITILSPGAAPRALTVLGPDSLQVGYWLLGGGRRPTYLGGGVRTDIDLIPAVCTHFALPVPAQYR